MSASPPPAPGTDPPPSPAGSPQDHPHDCGCGHDHDHDHDHAGHDHHHHHGHNHPHDGKSGAAAAGEPEWTRRFLLFLEMLVLFLWAAFMVWFYASGRINSYLIGSGSFRIQVLIAGLLLAVMGWYNWQMRAVPATCGHDHGPGVPCDHDHGDHDHDYDHDHADGVDPHEGTPGGRGMALVILALSVAATAALTPDAFSDQYKRNMLSAYASRSPGQGSAPDQHRLTPDAPASGGMSLAVIEKYQKRNPAGNFELDVMQLYYSGADPEYAAVMKGQGVETTGQLVRDTASGDPLRWRVFVLQMTCCAADARPFALPVQFSGAVPDLQEMGWYKLTGKIDYVEERGVKLALLRAEATQATVRPREQRSF